MYSMNQAKEIFVELIDLCKYNCFIRKVKITYNLYKIIVLNRNIIPHTVLYIKNNKLFYNLEYIHISFN